LFLSSKQKRTLFASTGMHNKALITIACVLIGSVVLLCKATLILNIHVVIKCLCISTLNSFRSVYIKLVSQIHPFLYIRTPNFGAGAESSYIFGRFEAENVREMFLNIHGIPVSPNDFNVVEVILEQI